MFFIFFWTTKEQKKSKNLVIVFFCVSESKKAVWFFNDSILPQIKSLKMYVYRQNDIGYFKTIHQKTIVYVGLLHKNIFASKTLKSKFKIAIESEKDLVEKEWLLEILNI